MTCESKYIEQVVEVLQRKPFGGKPEQYELAIQTQ